MEEQTSEITMSAQNLSCGQAWEDYIAGNCRILQMGLLDHFVHPRGAVKWVGCWMTAVS